MSIGVAVVILVSLGVADEHPLRDTVPWTLRPSVDLLLDVMRAMDRALDFSSTQTEFLNLDGVIGIRMVDDQLGVFLSHHAGSLMVNSSAKRDLLTTLTDLRRKAKDTADTAVPKVSISQPEYFNSLGILLKEGQWALDYPTRSLPNLVDDLESSRPLTSVPFLEERSDACMHELTGSSTMTSPPCNISSNCWSLMTSPGYAGYPLTHQVLYLEVGEMNSCMAQMMYMSSSQGRGNVSTLHDSFCSQVLSEAENIESNGYPQNQQDLLMEQIVVCGILGYREFLNEDWLRAIMSWQDSIGCYTRPEFEGNRVKREDRRLQGGCSAHKTAVALGSLVSGARFLLEAIIDGATLM